MYDLFFVREKINYKS